MGEKKDRINMKRWEKVLVHDKRIARQEQRKRGGCPDGPRCSEFGHSYDKNFRKSNSLYNHYRDERISRVINSITKKSLGV